MSSTTVWREVTHLKVITPPTIPPPLGLISLTHLGTTRLQGIWPAEVSAESEKLTTNLSPSAAGSGLGEAFMSIKPQKWVYMDRSKSFAADLICKFGQAGADRGERRVALTLPVLGSNYVCLSCRFAEIQSSPLNMSCHGLIDLFWSFCSL